MIGLAIGAWTPVLAGAPMLSGRRTSRPLGAPTSMMREAMLSTAVLLAFFVLSNLDALVARNLLDENDSGLYASGLILAKAAFFLPQFVSVVLFPDLARATSHHARTGAVSLVALLGALTVAGTAVLPGLALVLVGGHEYEAVRGRLWLFALAGSLLALVYLLVFDALARHDHRILLMIWGAVAAVLVAAYGLDVGITGLVLAVILVTGTLAAIVAAAPLLTRRERST
jgi:O-antigen/teichoic acid export membrane protein